MITRHDTDVDPRCHTCFERSRDSVSGPPTSAGSARRQRVIRMAGAAFRPTDLLPSAGHPDTTREATRSKSARSIRSSAAAGDQRSRGIVVMPHGRRGSGLLPAQWHQLRGPSIAGQRLGWVFVVSMDGPEFVVWLRLQARAFNDLGVDARQGSCRDSDSLRWLWPWSRCRTRHGGRWHAVRSHRYRAGRSWPWDRHHVAGRPNRC